jgi:Flp pilus assembly protein TadB
MSPSSTQQWTRRIRYSDQHIRVSDAERNAVAELLGQHYADGRLDQAEFDDRVGRTMAATTRGDLAGLFDDLPETGPAGAGPDGPAGPSAPYRGPRRRSGIGRALLLLILVFICANVAWHAFTSLFFIQPLVWAFVIIAVIMLVNRSAHRRER